jgi:hypothetical protein
MFLCFSQKNRFRGDLWGAFGDALRFLSLIHFAFVQEHDELRMRTLFRSLRKSRDIIWWEKNVFSAKLQGAMGILSTRFVRKARTRLLIV